MKNILIGMFKDFNHKSEGIYFVDPVAHEVKYSKPGGKCEKVCSFDQIKNAIQEKEYIKLEGNKNLMLTISGPKIVEVV